MAFAQSNTNDFISILKEGFFEIPEYQRRYSWEKQNQKELYNDLVNAKKEDKDHFFGTLSIRKIRSEGIHKYYHILDGQQRFTSLLLLCHVLAHSINLKEYFDSVVNKNNNFILTPINEEDKLFLNSMLDYKSPKPKTLSQSKMTNCFNMYKKLIDRDLKNKDEQKKFINFILNRSNFLIYLVKDEAESIRMFEIINDRGLLLGYFDKLKSFFIYYSNKYLKDSLNESINVSFNAIYKYFDTQDSEFRISKRNDETLLLHHYLSNPEIFSGFTKNWHYTKGIQTIYSDIKESLINTINNNKLEEGKIFIKNYLNDIVKFTETVENIEKKIVKKQEYIDFYMFLVPHQPMIPFSIRLEILNVLDATIVNLEKIEFYLKSRRNPKKNIFNILRVIQSQKNLKSLDEYINNELYKLYTWQSKDASDIIDIDWALKFVLYKKNKLENSQNNISYNLYKQLELEHIFPQEFDGLQDQFGFIKETYERDIEECGNFALLEKPLNIEAGHKTPKDKKDIYLKSEIAATRNLNINSKGDVQKRSKEIKKFAEEYFSIQDPS